jgi:hypothetical protein
MLESVVELLGGLLLNALTLLIGSCWLDYCGPTSRQRWKLRRKSWKKRKAVLITGAAFCTSLVLNNVALARS